MESHQQTFVIKETRMPALTIHQKGDRLAYRGLAFQVVFDTRTGTMTALDYGSGQLLQRPLKPVVKYAGNTPDLRLARILRSSEGNSHSLTCFFKGNGIQGHLICHFQIHVTGEIAIEAAVRSRKPLIAFDLDDGLEKDQPLPAGQIHKVQACIRRP